MQFFFHLTNALILSICGKPTLKAVIPGEDSHELRLTTLQSIASVTSTPLFSTAISAIFTADRNRVLEMKGLCDSSPCLTFRMKAIEAFQQIHPILNAKSRNIQISSRRQFKI